MYTCTRCILAVVRVACSSAPSMASETRATEETQTVATAEADVAEPRLDIMQQFASTNNPISMAEMDILYGPNDADIDKQFAVLETCVRERIDFLRKNRVALRKHVDDTDATGRAAKRPRASLSAEDVLPDASPRSLSRKHIDEAFALMNTCTPTECAAFMDDIGRALRRSMAMQALRRGDPSSAGYVGP